MKSCQCLALLFASLISTPGCSSLRLEQRDQVTYRRGPYNFDFYSRHNRSYRTGSAIHFAHGKAHDVAQITPLDKSDFYDQQFDAEMVNWLFDAPRVEPHMEYWGPHTGLFAWQLYRAIDWTHIHHEQTYDILSSRDIPWSEKKKWTDAAVRYYLKWVDVARSPAPLDVTMRRAGTMMKPYFGYFRTYYPESAKFFFAAHWWHPAIYEAMMVAGSNENQEGIVAPTDDLMFAQVIKNRPLRMLLSREMMPRYSTLSPESANIFDNLHMLHGIAYDILAYPKWSEAEKRAELYRVIDAMGEQPGDEEIARKFPLIEPSMDPRKYEPWMTALKSPGLGMNEIMAEMLSEMWPMMSADGAPEPPSEVWEQFWLKMEPGMQQGEVPGSLHDAIVAVYPNMKMNHDAMRAGKSSEKMVEKMLSGWRDKHGAMPPVPAYSAEPTSSSSANRVSFAADAIGGRAL